MFLYYITDTQTSNGAIHANFVEIAQLEVGRKAILLSKKYDYMYSMPNSSTNFCKFNVTGFDGCINSAIAGFNIPGYYMATDWINELHNSTQVYIAKIANNTGKQY